MLLKFLKVQRENRLRDITACWEVALGWPLFLCICINSREVAVELALDNTPCVRPDKGFQYGANNPVM